MKRIHMQTEVSGDPRKTLEMNTEKNRKRIV